MPKRGTVYLFCESAFPQIDTKIEANRNSEPYYIENLLVAAQLGLCNYRDVFEMLHRYMEFLDFSPFRQNVSQMVWDHLHSWLAFLWNRVTEESRPSEKGFN